jgi:peptidoglycan/xylan/chitin deacetylase (PgdA/CDA1 family)
MYHGISEPDGRLLHPYFETRTSSMVFEEHMRYLSENGYSSIGLNDLPGAVENGSNAGRIVVITFDDGCRDFLDNAFPVLEKYGLKATVFLPTGLMGTKRSALVGSEIMGWGDANQLQKQGIMFGSHTVNHLLLKKMILKDVEYELRNSKEEIESRLGSFVDSFSYPYAYPEENPTLGKNYIDILSECGYRFGVTTIIGRYHAGDNLFVMKRLPINDYDDPFLFQAKLEGNYDWVHIPQYLRKKFFGWVGK